MTKTKAKAYSYLRFSSPEQMKGDSLRRQTKLAEDYARAHGLDLDDDLNLKDLGVSAFRGDNIETGALGAFLRAIQDGAVTQGSYLLVESLDRVSRKAAARAANVLQSICYAGVKVITLADERVYDQETLDEDPIAFIYAVLVFFRAHEESATKSRRLKAAWHGKRAKAHEKTLTAITPGWIELDEHRKPVLIEERARVVRRIVKDVLRGVGKHAIARALNTEGVEPFGRAKHWHRSYVAKIVESPALVGTFVPHIDDYKDGKVRRVPQVPVPGYFPSVIDADTHARLQDVVQQPAARGRHATKPLQSILSGLARCPDCGATMTRVAKGSRSRPKLVCTRAKVGAANHYRSVPYEVLESELLGNYETILRDMPHPDAEIDRGLQNAQAVVDELDGRMGELMALLERRPSDALAARVADLELHANEARNARDEWSERASRSERKTLQLRVEALGVAIRAKPLNRARVNAALRELVESVTVDYHTGHLVFRWRSGGESSLLFMWPKEAA
jgi:DNA invertase Pin-like site-specific DNA recombinase